MRELAERLPLEVCLSGYVTGVYPSFEAHPLARLVEAGVAVTQHGRPDVLRYDARQGV
ncbi:MAG: hypothetical protein R2724_30970 [Bryobacterales bacterium]